MYCMYVYVVATKTFSAYISKTSLFSRTVNATVGIVAPIMATATSLVIMTTTTASNAAQK